jgi:hypothetical protein
LWHQRSEMADVRANFSEDYEEMFSLSELSQ